MNEKKIISNKLSEENNDFIKVKREKSKKLEPQIIQNALEIQPLRTIDLSKREFTNVMSPSKSGFKKNINHNYTKLKSKSKGKEIKEIKSPLNGCYKQRNFQAILLPKKTLGRSLPKTTNFNKNFESQNFSINNIKRITLSNNIEVINNIIIMINLIKHQIQIPNIKVIVLNIQKKMQIIEKWEKIKL
jgi:hypothetical protein